MARKNAELINILTCIQRTMETLSVYNEQSKIILDIYLTHRETLSIYQNTHSLYMPCERKCHFLTSIGKVQHKAARY